ncbi:unconventional prefoldin RPB5 interactor-like isoform X2 [Macrobrachium nipponense]|uniref:unconventional prefoldin RPB5 interactor-like isoform X2 n=1 Tax=Macrobrachium nipponense TaxID=159736 RepID=UPI0030C81E10
MFYDEDFYFRGEVMKKRSSSDTGGEKDGAGTKYSVQSLQNNLENLVQLQHEHRQRLELVEKEYNQLRKFKDDYLHLQKRLRTLPDKTSHEVMVPIGPLAFMPGRLIHTNEILVLLGDNWFAERSAKEAAEIVKRRVKDCNEKIETAENQMNLHKNWLEETSGLFEEDKDQVEIIEELTEEEFERSKEEHRKKLAEDYEKRKSSDQESRTEEETPEAGASTSQENFIEKLDEDDKKAYENLMKRLDQLEMEEDDESGGSQDADDYDRYIRHSETAEEIYSADDGAEHATGTEDTELSASGTPVLYKRNKRRVSWADDTRPLFTIIPDDNSESTYRIKYTTKQLSLPLIEWDPASARDTPEENIDQTDSSSAVIQSPSELYKTFGERRRSSLPDPPPRGILKKTHSSTAEASSSLCSSLIPTRMMKADRVFQTRWLMMLALLYL